MITRDQIKASVEAEGLMLIGVVSPETGRDHERFEAWLRQRRHAEMYFLESYPKSRSHARAVLPAARSVVVFALGYYQGDRLNQDPAPGIAQYARFPDYHRLLKQRGESIASRIFNTEHKYRVTVDSAPVLERALAAKSSQGFIGKNTLFIHPQQGSFLLLGEIVTSADLIHDQKVPIDPNKHLPQGGCGICNRCQVACPTGALSEDYQLDANLCLAYWTIEHRGAIPEKFWPWLKIYYFGCDLCQLACPYNRRESVAYLPADIKKRSFPPLFDIATMDQYHYEKWFGGTPLTRAKRNGLRRNALIAMTVNQDPLLPRALEYARLDNASPIFETLQQISQYRLATVS